MINCCRNSQQRGADPDRPRSAAPQVVVIGVQSDEVVRDVTQVVGDAAVHGDIEVIFGHCKGKRHQGFVSKK